MTADIIYRPRADTLPAQVVAFFTRNPDEELTLDDISDKFDCTRGNIHTQLGKCIEHNLLKRGQNKDGEYAYTRGPNCPKQDGVDMDAVHNATQARLLTTAINKGKPGTVITVLPDPNQVMVDDGIPIPTVTNGKARRSWTPLLTRLKPSQSAALPLAAKFTLLRDITDLHKAHAPRYTVRTFKDQNQLRVWRTE